MYNCQKNTSKFLNFILPVSFVLLTSTSHAAISALNSDVAPTGFVASGIVAGANMIDGVSFTNTGGDLLVGDGIAGNATTTIDFFTLPAGTSSSPEVIGFTLAFNDLHDGGGNSTFSISATTESGDTLVLTSQEGPAGGNPSIGFGSSADFQWSTSLNGGAEVDSGIFLTLGQGATTFFSFTADDASNPIVSASVTWSSPTSPDGITFEGLSFTTAPIPEPSVAMLGLVGLIGLARRNRS